MIFLAFPYRRPLPKGQWAVAYICTTNYHKLILMQATAKRAMGGGFRRNSDSELKLRNRCTGSTGEPLRKILDLPLNCHCSFILTDRLMYWTDLADGRLYKSSLDGSNRNSLYQYEVLPQSSTSSASASAHYYGLVQSGEFIYFTTRLSS